MWHFLNAKLTDKAVLVLHPLHIAGDEIAAAFKNDGADVHLHGDRPQPDCMTPELHPSGRHDVVVVCHNEPRLSSTRLMDYAAAYAPHLEKSRGTLIFVLLNEACALSDQAPDSNPIQKFAHKLGETFGPYGIRVNIIARREPEMAETTTRATKKRRNSLAEESPAPLTASIPEVAVFLASPLNTYITGLALTADA